ncbi:hypothetical protein AM2_118 [Lactococcus phage AM2]|uniref:Uncharacterized protein n=7 Tax=Audreyjarvisvirus AM1 TaxID=2845188 RepID=A0A1W6JLQ8_9CAUD|nr:hypothetical protein H1Z30_gp153 [Lactococcus phage AM1]ARM66423.1 hypothetical protein AM2_118 [Lactococcus phage AM2]ARM66600.1 hypothetical protein AM3_118 [Lactococcus phage AM3]ARM67154.1 hypothetical protein AM8_119 [Lactococcus phage AM8]ARM67332.1 hypothetical protein AM9_119 [Lactococcus phage AM9]ARM67511.1 hypothetical protein AM11_119 [Lactococcus phage AM11]ARQ95698.1 hypothetical protein AM12_119 [Lactococcus phage AM12]
MYNDEFWDFSVPYEQEYVEFFNNLKNSVKEGIKQELEGLKDENSRLQKIVDGIQEKEANISRRERDLQTAIEVSAQSAKSLALKELLEPLENVYWDITYKHELMPQCDKCDRYRRREYTTPMGRVAYEKCSCDIGKSVYFPQEMTLYKIYKKDKQLNGYYTMNTRGGSEELAYYGGSDDGSFETKTPNNFLMSKEEDFKNYSRFNSVFATKELCEKYCEKLQKEEDIKLQKRLEEALEDVSPTSTVEI